MSQEGRILVRRMVNQKVEDRLEMDNFVGYNRADFERQEWEVFDLDPTGALSLRSKV